MTLNAVYFLALFFAALALVPAGAHLAELPHKMALGRDEYLTVQQIYSGWALFGIVVFGALGSTLWLAVRLRRHSAPFRPALAAFLCIAGTQLVFWSLTFPTNQVTRNWTMLPENWAELRHQWEYSHAASVMLNLAAMIALITSVLRYGDARGALPRG